MWYDKDQCTAHRMTKACDSLRHPISKQIHLSSKLGKLETRVSITTFFIFSCTGIVDGRKHLARSDDE